MLEVDMLNGGKNKRVQEIQGNVDRVVVWHF